MRVNINETTSRRRPNSTPSGTFGAFSRSIKNVMNASKKDDDFGGYFNDIEGKHSKHKSSSSFLRKLASLNPMVLIIVAAIGVTVFLLVIVTLFSAMFSSDHSSTSSSSTSGSRNAYSDYRSTSTAGSVLQPGLKAMDLKNAHFEINQLMKDIDDAKDDISMQVYHAWDRRISHLIQTHCVKQLPFTLELEAQQTLESHVSYLLSAVLDNEAMYQLSPQNTVVTQHGILLDLSRSGDGPRSNTKSAPCGLVTALLEKAASLNLFKYPYESVEPEDHLFEKTYQDTWSQHQAEFAHQDVNQAAFALLQLAKDDGEHLHLAKMLIPSLLGQFCPNIDAFLSRNASTEKDKSDSAKLALVNSVEDVLTQLHRNKNIVMHKNEIPAIDKNGYLVAVDKFQLNAQQKFNDNWVSCHLIDKIVYYHNADIEQQAKVCVDLVRDHNYYAFENQLDIMMVEHCADTVRVLKSKKAAHEQADVYQSIFRGELISFAMKVANGEYLGTDTDSFVVTDSGGIMHKYATSTQFTECEVIKAIGKQDVYYSEQAHGGDGGGDKKEVPEFNENAFNPDYHDYRYDDFEHELHHNQQNLEVDAKAVVQHALKEEQYQLRRLLTNMLYLYHMTDVSKMSAEQMESLVSDINTYVTALVGVDYGTTDWPETHVAALDVQNAVLLLLEKSSSDLDGKNKVESPFLTKVFQIALSSRDAAAAAAKDKKSESGGGAAPAKDDQHNNNDEIKSYVSLLLKDITQQTDILEMKKELEKDLDHYCGELMRALEANTRAKRKFFSALFTLLQKPGAGGNNKMVDPVVDVEDGAIRSAEGADQQKVLKCPFLTELITQSVV